jgi:Coenzyme PQQ synthesis protein D (PqqD)
VNETAARFRTSPDVVARDIAEGLMLVNVQTGAAFKLNQVGAAVWRHLDGAREVASIIAELRTRYGVDADRLQCDVDALLADLQQQGLVLPVGPG